MAAEHGRHAAPPFERLARDGGAPGVPEGPPDWPLREERIWQQLRAVWESGDWGRYQTEWTERLIEQLQVMHQTSHVLLCCSGTVAVELALRGAGVRAGDEVILAAYDFPGNFRAIEAIGATPVLVDIDPSRWCLTPAGVQQALGPLTRAVVVSHLHGGLADMEQIVQLAHAAGVRVVEDACQAPGGIVQGRCCGTWGDVGVLSFGGSKLLTAGRGGALLTNDASICQRAKIYGERGNDAFPLSALQAAVLLPQLETLHQQNEQRRRSVQLLVDACSSLVCLQILDPSQQNGLACYYKLAFRLRDEGRKADCSRGDLLDALKREGIAAGPGFGGFVRRGHKRCRKAGSVAHAAEAAQTTILLHHPALLQPESYVDLLATTLAKVDYWFRER